MEPLVETILVIDAKRKNPHNLGMAKDSIYWLVKMDGGGEVGPFTTEAVLKLISDGSLQGAEKIRKLPNGSWIPISKNTEFYDKLLENLEHAPKNRFEETRKPQKPKPPLTFEELDKTVTIQQEPPPQKTKFEATYPTYTPSDKSDYKRTVISAKNENRSQKGLGLLLLAIGIGIITYILFFDGENKVTTEKIHLLRPRINFQAAGNPAESKASFAAALPYFVIDNYEGYSEAQKSLVKAIESNSQWAEPYGLLCLVYKELWPYVKQDSEDLDSLSFVAQNAKRLDPLGIHGTYCEVSKLILLGKIPEARGVLDHALNQPQMLAAPILFVLKGEILAAQADAKTAALYAEKAQSLWPQWVKPYFDFGNYSAQAQMIPEAAQAFGTVIKMNPKHKAAVVELGNLQLRAYNQYDAAKELFSSAVSSPGRMKSNHLHKAYLGLALIALQSKNSKAALTNIQKAYSYNPADPETKDLLIKLGGNEKVNKKSGVSEVVALGDSYFRSGNYLAAQAQYKAAFEIDPTHGSAAMKAAKSLWNLNQSQEAINWLTKAIQADPKLISAYALQADYYSQRFNIGAAAAVLSKAAQLFPQSFEVLRGFGQLEYRRNNMKDAISFLQRALKLNENDSESLILIAQAFGFQKDFKQASQYAIKATEVDSVNPEAHIVYAKVLSHLYNYDSGISYMKTMINKYSYTLEYRTALADILKEAERHKQAAEIYQQVVDANPKSKKAFLGLGESYQAIGRFDLAVKAFFEAAILDPSDAEPLVKAGVIYLESDKYKEAVTQFQRASKANPFYPRIQYYIGRALFMNGDYDLALSAAMEERKINPNLADSYLLAADVYTATKQFQKCSAEYQQALKLRPQGAEIYVKIARCYRQGGSPDVAESMLTMAAQQESGYADIYKEQGAIYETKGDARAAVQAYNKYLALSPNAKDKKEIEARILKISGGR